MNSSLHSSTELRATQWHQAVVSTCDMTPAQSYAFITLRSNPKAEIPGFERKEGIGK